MWKHFWLSELGSHYWYLVGKTPNTVKYPTVHRAPPQQRLILSNISIVRRLKILCQAHSPVFPRRWSESVFQHLHVWERLGFRYLMNLIIYQHEKGGKWKKKSSEQRKDESPKIINHLSFMTTNHRKERAFKEKGRDLVCCFSLLFSFNG